MMSNSVCHPASVPRWAPAVIPAIRAVLPAPAGAAPPCINPERGLRTSPVFEKRRHFLTMALFATVLGCSPKIGDECATALDCSALGDRLCDTTQPGGYCTIFNCEPDTCPEEAACVAFGGEHRDSVQHCRFFLTVTSEMID